MKNVSHKTNTFSVSLRLPVQAKTLQITSCRHFSTESRVVSKFPTQLAHSAIMSSGERCFNALKSLTAVLTKQLENVF